MALAFAGIANADEPAILADLAQSHSVQTADAATLDAAQGADYINYRVYYALGNNYYSDPRSKLFRNWNIDYSIKPYKYYSNIYNGYTYTNGLGMLIWKSGSRPINVSPWCNSY